MLFLRAARQRQEAVQVIAVWEAEAEPKRQVWGAHEECLRALISPEVARAGGPFLER
jgi:hypothetical protein